MTGPALDVLLIEDNPGDARLIEEMLRDAQEHLQRIDLDEGTPERTGIHHARDLSAGLEHLSESDVDVILLDLELPDSSGQDTLVSVIEQREFTPIVVLTGLDDRSLGVQAIQQGAQDYLVKDEVTGELLVHSMQHAIERVNRKRERVRHREQLESLNRLNRISQEIAHDVITTSTREELEQAVCERLVESDAYRFAWIGEVDRATDRLAPRTTAGMDDEYGEFTLSIDDESSGAGPEASTARTRKLQVAQDVQMDSASDWRAWVSGWESLSIAAIPISHRTVFYGILAIYAESPTAFSEHEREILSRLGDVIGHAITTIERKEALVSETVVQLEFRLEDVAPELISLSTERECRFEFESVVRSENGLLVYGHAEGVSRETVDDLADRTAFLEEVRILSARNEGYEGEFLTTAGNELLTTIATHGGSITSATIADGEFRFVVEFPSGQDRHQLIELVKEHCAGATLHAQRTVKRDDPDTPGPRSVFQDRLTEKQQAALEAAYHAGYFDWPRTSSGEEIADRLGITQATFSQHFRAAEREFFSAVFENAEDETMDSSPWTLFGTGAKRE
jgi:predicted DNA binding protein/DNA-binding NarL/FixJ family response regulator